MNRNVWVVSFGSGLRLFGLALLLPFLALYLHNVLGLGYLAVTAVTLATTGVQVPASLLGGILGDLWGRRSLILGSLVLEAAFMGLLAWAMELSLLLPVVLMAVLGGSAGAVGQAPASAYLADLTSPGPERTRAFTVRRVGWNAGFGSGVAAGGLLVGSLGFPRVALVACIAIGVGVLFLSYFLEPTPTELRQREERRRRASEPHHTPSRWEGLRRTGGDRRFLELCLASLFIGMVTGQWGYAFVLFVNGPAGLPYSVLGLGLALNGFAVVFGQSLTTESVLGRRHTSIALGSVVAYTAGFLGFAVAVYLHYQVLALFFVAVLVITLGENLFAIPSSTLPSNLAPDEDTRSTYNGAFQMYTTIGALFSLVLGGVALAYLTDPLLLWLALLWPAVPAGLLFRHLGRTLPADRNRA